MCRSEARRGRQIRRSVYRADGALPTVVTLKRSSHHTRQPSHPVRSRDCGMLSSPTQHDAAPGIVAVLHVHHAQIRIARGHHSAQRHLPADGAGLPLRYGVYCTSRMRSAPSRTMKKGLPVVMSPRERRSLVVVVRGFECSTTRCCRRPAREAARGQLAVGVVIHGMRPSSVSPCRK